MERVPSYDLNADHSMGLKNLRTLVDLIFGTLRGKVGAIARSDMMNEQHVYRRVTRIFGLTQSIEGRNDGALSSLLLACIREAPGTRD